MKLAQHYKKISEIKRELYSKYGRKVLDKRTKIGQYYDQLEFEQNKIYDKLLNRIYDIFKI